MIIFLYPGLELELLKLPKAEYPSDIALITGDEFWWTPDISFHNNTYIRDMSSLILFESEEDDKVVITTECQPVMREYIHDHKGKEKIAIIFPSEGLKESYLDRMEKEYLGPLKLHHIKENFNYDIRAIAYEAGYNRNWYDIAYAIKNKDYNILDIINKFRMGDIK